MSGKNILIIGASGQTGRLVVEYLEDMGEKKNLILATRNQETAADWRWQGFRSAVVDLDNPATVAAAMNGVDYVYLVTGYSVSMVAQTKAVVDIAAKAGVEFMVHQGVFDDGSSLVPHFAWHTLVETYIKAAGIGWCHLHPNYFMENLLSVLPVKNGNLDWYMADAPIGWIALDDLAVAAATVLTEGPEKHAGKDYFLSTEVMNGADVAHAMSETLGTEVGCTPKQPEQLLQGLESGVLQLAVEMEPNYANSGLVFMQTLASGAFPYIQQATDDYQALTGKEPTAFKEWAAEHSRALLAALKKA